MEIAVIAAGFTPGEADQMRRSMAAWKHSGGLEQFEHRLKAGMAARGHAAAFADRIYRQILGFGSYGFPESHAISFALLAYVSSYLKCHEPAAFFAALLNSQPMGFYPPSMLVGEARRMGVELRPVDVSASEWDCTLEPSAGNPGEPAIRLGLRLVSGLRQEAAARIVAARKSAAFADIDDLAARAVLDARTRRALADADALQSLAGDRHAARWAAAGYQPLPGLLRGAAARETIPPLPAPREGADILDDYRSLRLTLRQHPLALLRPRLTRLGVSPSAELRKLPDRTGVKVAGLVMFRQRPQTPTGLMFMTLEDETGIVNLIVPARHLDAQRDALIGSRLLLVEGELQNVAGDTVPRSVGAGAGECGHPSAHDDNSSHAAAGQVVHVFLRAAQDRSDWIGDLPYLSRDFH
jgi:error-prone DNA polymerase